MPFKDPEKRRAYHRRRMRERRGRGILNKVHDVFERQLRDFWRPRYPDLSPEELWTFANRDCLVDLFSVKEAAAEIGVHENTLRRWIKEGRGKYLIGHTLDRAEILRLKKIGKWKRV